MYTQEVTVNNEVGLHARPATYFIMKAKKKLRILLAALLCIVMLAGVLPAATLAADQVPTDTPRFTTGVSRSRTATPLDPETWTSDITLSLPSA